MMSLSSLSKALLAAYAGVPILCVSAAASLADWPQIGTIAAPLGMVAALVSAYCLVQARRAVKQATEICHAVAQGDFEARVIGIRDQGDVRAMLLSINEMIDRCDAYVREFRRRHGGGLRE